MAGNKLLSLCMIAADGRFLNEWLSEWEPVADEIVIADISPGGSVAVAAEKKKVKVLRLRWEDDFAKAKNALMEKAACRWVLFVQPDETVLPENRAALRPLLDDITAEGYLFYIDGHCPDCAVLSPTDELRLLRGRGEYRFSYASYEKLPDELALGIKSTDIPISHRGDASLSWEFRTKKRLLRKELEKHVDDGYLQYRAGIELLNRADFAKSAEYLAKAHQSVNCGCLYAPHLMKCLGWVLLKLGRDSEALAALDEGIALYPDFSDYYVLRAQLSKQRGAYDRAAGDLKRCIEIAEDSAGSVPAPEIGPDTAFELLGEICREQGNRDAALDCYRQAYELNHSEECLHIIEELKTEGDPAE